MAIFQVSKKTDRKSTKNIRKIVGISLIAVASVFFLFAVTKLWPAFQYFLKGTFGVFIYPLSILLIIIGIALLNNKKYVMSKKYATFLILSFVFLLAIIQLIIVGDAYDGEGNPLNFGQYLGLSYIKQNTAGGVIIGLLTTCLVKLVKLPASYIILSLALVVCVAFFVEEFISTRKNVKQASPVKIQIKEKKLEKKNKEILVKKPKEEINVVLDGRVQENLSREQIAKQKLGLVGSTSVEQTGKREFQVQEKPEEKIPSHMSLKEYLLSPPKVDIDTFMSNRPKTVKPQPSVNQAEMNKAFNEIKSEQIKPSQYLFEEEYNVYKEPQKRGNLPEIKPEELVSEADDIIKSVARAELEQMEIEPHNDANVINQENNDAKFEDNLPRLDSFSRDRVLDRDSSLVRENQLNRVGDRSFDRSYPTSREDAFQATNSRREGLENVISRRSEENTFERRDTQRVDLTRKEKKFISLDEEDDKPVNKPYKYKKPSIDLITTTSDDLSTLNDEVPAKRVALENALEQFGVPAKVQSVVIGPTVTRYEIAMPEGVSVKKVLSLDADIAYALSAKGDIRIEAPIPGRSIVGIEVPNNKVAKVSIKDVLESKEFTMSPSPLAFALGKDITGTVRVCNLQKMPHLLVAGTTGSGKSVCLNSIIVSMLYRASPDDVKFIMIDPKQVELSMYEGLPHMVIPKVITDPVKTVNALQWAVDEMEKRFNLISDARVRNIDEYNRTEEVTSGKKKKMPYLVIIFDEFADFMLVAKNEIEDKIRRLAQKARAAGIHLILATQRPSTDVVTGTIKANFPGRIAFKVAGRVDSEVIMGATGAEKLLGYGDMLYKPTDSSPARIQGCFIDTPETKDIVNFIIENNEEVIDEEALNAINCPGKSGGAGDGGDSSGMDPLLPQALKLCIDAGVASTTMVQRKLSIGYPRAARIIDQMEERGYISTAEGSKQRSVYTSIEEYYQIFGDDYD